MPHQLLLYIIALIAGASVSSFLGIYAFIKIRHAPGGKYFCAAAFLAAFFALTYAFELTSDTLEKILFWVAVEYLAIAFLPAVTLLMCADYAARKPRKWMYAVLFGIPVITVMLNWTNSYHHFYYTSVGLGRNMGHPVARLEGGPWFWVQTVFLYFCVLAGAWILLSQLKRVSSRFHIQILMMGIGILIPVAGTLFYLSGLSGGLDFGPVFMCASFLFHGAALLRFRMFDVVPVARETIFESLEEGVLVLDQREMIVDYNRAMKPLLPFLTDDAIGRPLKEILGFDKQLADILQSGQEGDYKLIQGSRKLHFHIRFASLLNKKKEPVGKIVMFINITERVQMEEQLQKLARTDGLTGLLNRTFFLEQAEAACFGIKEKGDSVSLIMFDIDHFKQVNDTFGHEAGDLVLMKVAETARKSMRSQDLLARYGGEEFIIFLPHTSLADANERAEALRTAIAEATVYVEDKALNVTSSFGISQVWIEAGSIESPVQMLMREADQALYAAKRNGRNCVQTLS
ncbi:histidine kinase N-terminal 7TM domain-containing diguanylate cyclase [Domibacillus indicus]|uniref:histidine kinase N-terminal 7TM domain-containing diguanylate cyclase n=1 Tax=Domibacillus indicus TaxID=1437523 RepID=UPI00061823FA|nr:histidine kinase N-terminal 7TM domain-containing protein [Domibacillus indicus]